MASFMDQVKRLLQSPSGQRVVRRATEFAKDPKTQQKIRQFMDKRRKH